jgi:hypothetical protein
MRMIPLVQPGPLDRPLSQGPLLMVSKCRGLSQLRSILPACNRLLAAATVLQYAYVLLTIMSELTHASHIVRDYVH